MLDKREQILSFVIPVKDEEATVSILAEEIINVVKKLDKNYTSEIIFIDDGSTDNSWNIIKDLSEKYKNIVYGIALRRNFGKSIALEAGFRNATGDIIFTMDADLQDDPLEIPRFVEALESGYDLVSGWKVNRLDPPSKTIPSKIFNKVTSFLTKVPLHDFNCGYKAYKAKVIKSLRLYGELHRYIPVLAHDLGFKVGEISVTHHPRRHGKSKFGIERYVRGFLDLLTVLATTRWLLKPGHLFGGIGLLLGCLGGGILVYLTALWFLGGGPIGDRPLLIFGVLFSLISIQMISLGIIAEFFIRVKNPREVSELISKFTRD